jgi:hypothetical protein
MTIHITPEALTEGRRVAELLGTHYNGQRIAAVRIAGTHDEVLVENGQGGRWVDIATLNPALLTRTTSAIAGAA